MNRSSILYHGSFLEIAQPDLVHSRPNVDFGSGFYVTPLYEQAAKWCGKFKRRGKDGIISKYEYDESREAELKVLKFDAYSEEWLDFIVDCRRGIRHDYDIVEGPMADDTIWNFIEDFVKGEISRAAFWELVKFKHPTHQIVFCSQKALDCIKYISNYSL